MWRTIYFVDWKILLEHYKKETLVRALLDSEDTPNWAEVYHDLPISDHLYNAVATAYETLRTGLPEKLRQDADSFMLPLITFEGYHQDLDHANLTSLIQSLNPQSVIKYALLADEIDWGALQEAYYEFCSDSTRKTIATYTNCENAEKSFRRGFLGYIEDEWIEPIYMAARKKQGIVVDYR
ncbi:hypothetical protein [[Leptolyngbya] sp. PCC 7376]|uniref:hypothetical protein n=1 Tax=[Leptolyngbya] sp. PCC 7376 TaxID=111781 RepID=UPI0005A2B523|nr:hypothetical protein [[Leptolyngbya] sp. PCC 7376]